MRQTNLIIALLLLSATAAAEETDSHFQIGVLGSKSQVKSRFILDDQRTGQGVLLAWRFNANWLIEAGYSNVGRFQNDCGGLPCVRIALPEVSLHAKQLGAVAQWPIRTSDFFLQGSVGVHQLDTDLDKPLGVAVKDETEVNGFASVGLGYAINSRVDVVLRFDRFQARLPINRLALSANLKF